MFKKILLSLGALFAVLIIIGMASGGDETADTETTQTNVANADSDNSGGGEAKKKPAAEAPEKEEPAKPELTAGQVNAIRSAVSYLDMSAFSKSGLIDQLKFEDYSVKDATYAVNHIDVNWNEQAAASAESYLEMSGFSRQGLIDQLKFEGFTQEQAEFGVKKAGL